MGLQGILSPKVLHRQAELFFCLWCRKEGQYEGTVGSYLQMSHYHLGLICSQCLKYFTTGANAMCHHSQLCKLAVMGINNDNDDPRGEI